MGLLLSLDEEVELLLVPEEVVEPVLLLLSMPVMLGEPVALSEGSVPPRVESLGDIVGEPGVVVVVVVVVVSEVVPVAVWAKTRPPVPAMVAAAIRAVRVWEAFISISFNREDLVQAM